MLTLRVTNSTDARHSWNVEPYGDEVWLSPGDVLEVQYRCSIDVVLDVGVHPDADVVWAEFAGTTALPEALMLNGLNLWPN